MSAFEGRRATVWFDAKPLGSVVWGGVRIAKPRGPDQRNVILVSIDTLRGDHVGVAGYKRRDISPNIDAVARAGAYFPVTLTSAPRTKPAHYSIFTGWRPRALGVLPSSTSDLPPQVKPLAEILHDNGFLTEAFTGGANVSAFYGFSRGFDRYLENADPRARPTGPGATEAGNVFGSAARWVSDHRSQRFFLFVHTYEVHAPYIHKEYLRPRAYKDPADEAADRYDSGIRFTDAALGRFLRQLEALGLDRQTIVVLTSDHGEEPGFGGEPMIGHHEQTLRDTTMRVLLAIRAPGLVPPHVVSKSQARSIDITPTILDLLGIPPPGDMQGASLAGIIRGEPSPPETFAIGDGATRWPDAAIRWEKSGHTYKFMAPSSLLLRLHSLSDPEYQREIDKGTVRLYDVTADPAEQDNVVRKNDGVAEFLRQRLSDYVVACPPVAEVKKETAPVSPELRERLRSLGY
ncbi:MAG: sulfatase [Elusimicrobia bacterium]|nr:sulfatase [Elusimicrobiota bacterium]